MKTGIEASTFGTQALNVCLYPFRKIAQGVSYLLGDIPAIIQQKENFFFQELSDRSVASSTGYASTYIGLPFLHAFNYYASKIGIPSLDVFNFFVFTGEAFVKEATSYGEYVKSNPGKFDAKARSLFEPIKDFLGDPSIINMNGPEVAEERRGIKNYLTGHRGEEAAWDVTEKIMQNWSNEKSINHTICLLCTQVIAQGWFNLKDVPEELVPLLKTAEYYVFNREKVTDADFEHLRAQIKALNDRVLTEQSANISEDDSYIGFLKTHRKKAHAIDLNALAGLVVEGNITTIITGAVLQLASNANLQNELREALVKLPKSSSSPHLDYEAIKNEPLLHRIYLETLRFYSPSPPLARYASKAGTINGVHIPARSYLFIPLRRIMHDPKQWTNPEIFDPSRHQGTGLHLNVYPLVPFSVGPRACPASFGFAEAMFKIALVQIFRENELTLTSDDSVEQIPVAVKEPRFKKTYKGELRRISLEDKSEFGPSQTRQFDSAKKSKKLYGPSNSLLSDAVQSSKAHKSSTLVSKSAVDESEQARDHSYNATSSSSEPVLKAGIK